MSLRVMCIDDDWKTSWKGIVPPKYGDILHVSDEKGCECGCGRMYYSFIEYGGWQFAVEHFIPLNDSDPMEEEYVEEALEVNVDAFNNPINCRCIL